jgi:hypothetical protein
MTRRRCRDCSATSNAIPAPRSAIVAEYLRPAAGQPAVLSAIRSAAAQDEDPQVRWAARYAQR